MLIAACLYKDPLQAHKPSSDCVVPRVTEEIEKGYACKVDSGHLQAADRHNL